MNKHDLTTGRTPWIIATSALGIAIILLAIQFWPAPAAAALGNHDAYYFDLGTGKFFTAPLGLKLPTNDPANPSQTPPQGVLAYVFSCGSCDDAGSRFPVLFESMDDKGVPVIAAVGRDGGKHLNWLPIGSPAADQVEAKAMKVRCPGFSTPTACHPADH